MGNHVLSDWPQHEHIEYVQGAAGSTEFGRSFDRSDLGRGDELDAH